MSKPAKNPAAVALGRRGGMAGTGRTKARTLSTEEARRRIAVRWAKRKKSPA